MSYITHIATAVPEYQISPEDTERFLSQATDTSAAFARKLKFLNSKTGIRQRYSCLPDFKGGPCELYLAPYLQPVEQRMELYRQKLIPLASKALGRLMEESGVKRGEVTHLITVSCTGMMAPGFEMLMAEQFGLLHCEKLALNFMGCYAGLKALKHAHSIAKADPEACVVVLSAELCSLHYYPSQSNEDLLAYLLFGDGAAAALVCGKAQRLAKTGPALKAEACGTAFIKDTASLMTWDLSSTAFRMFLSTEVVTALRNNVRAAVAAFLPQGTKHIRHWAIHPGGVRIVEAVQEQLGLSAEDAEDSLAVLRSYGNMSSATILFILQRTLEKIKRNAETGSGVFACAFGPGLNMEMMTLTAVQASGAPPLNEVEDESEILPERVTG